MNEEQVRLLLQLMVDAAKAVEAGRRWILDDAGGGYTPAELMEFLSDKHIAEVANQLNQLSMVGIKDTA